MMASRNQNSHFAMNPKVHVPRSRFDMSHSVKFTGCEADLIPFEVTEVLPGDSFTVNTGVLARLQTLIVPLMGDLFLDLFYFYVPNRLLWKNWQHFCGESDEPWFDDQEYKVPAIKVNYAAGATGTDTVIKGTVADLMGLPFPAPGTYSGTPSYTEINHLPIRAYCKIWSDWFRDENVDPLPAFNTEDNNVTMNNVGEAFYGGKLLKVNKFKDYFNACLPEPQRGDPVTIGIADSAPVFAGLTDVDLSKYPKTTGGLYPQLRFTNSNPSNTEYSQANKYMITYTDSAGASAKHYYTNNMPSATGPAGTGVGISPVNLYADMTSATGITINELRYAFATQRYLEQLARTGNRYIELLSGIFGVDAPDQRLQRAEYLGGNRVRVDVSSIVQSSETGTTPLGNIGAYSLTTDGQYSFDKSFVEHGWIIGVCCVRHIHSYQDGIDKQWLRRDFTDYYNPMLANIGEMPVENQEIFVSGTSADSEVFGYQEAWADYRYRNNAIRGELRSRYAQTLDYWHLGDNYTSQPYLDDDWRKEDGLTLDRAIAVSQRLADQFLFDFYVDMKATRPMPLFSVPGLDVL